MDSKTIDRLNQINQAFYRTTANEFDQTRGRPWPGWVEMLPYLSGLQPSTGAANSPFSVLDAGCGNGRLGLFLMENIPSGSMLHYHGMDTDITLLSRAEEALAAAGNPPLAHYSLESRDIIARPPDSGQYDLVALFGVMHHSPGLTQRQAFMKTLASRVTPGGLLVFACWRFYEYERFRARIVPWPQDLLPQVEAGDHLLDWRRGERALRYCH